MESLFQSYKCYKGATTWNDIEKYRKSRLLFFLNGSLRGCINLGESRKCWTGGLRRRQKMQKEMDASLFKNITVTKSELTITLTKWGSQYIQKTCNYVFINTWTAYILLIKNCLIVQLNSPKFYIHIFTPLSISTLSIFIHWFVCECVFSGRDGEVVALRCDWPLLKYYATLWRLDILPNSDARLLQIYPHPKFVFRRRRECGDGGDDRSAELNSTLRSHGRLSVV